MTFREKNQKYYVPIAQWTMIFGIAALCQPWSEFLHRYGLTITLIGLIAFLVVMHIAPEPEAETEDDEDDFPDPVNMHRRGDPAGGGGGGDDQSGVV